MCNIQSLPCQTLSITTENVGLTIVMKKLLISMYDLPTDGMTLVEQKRLTASGKHQAIQLSYLCDSILFETMEKVEKSIDSLLKLKNLLKVDPNIVF